MTSDRDGGSAGGGRTHRSRRTILAGAAGAVAAVAAETATRATSAQAAQGDPVLQGEDNGPVTTRTMIFTTQNGEFASLCDNSSHGHGSVGVLGHGGNVGVCGEATTFFGTGVVGSSAGGSGTGVAGYSTSGNGTGVTGEGAGTGSGVYGRGGPNGNDLNDSGAGITGVGGGSGPGVAGTGGTQNGTGVHGTAAGTGAGVRGDGGLNGTGVAGFGGSGSNGVEGTGGPGQGIGVWGMGQGTGAGVLGTGFHGPAVHGRADFADAIGVLAENTAGGLAFRAAGPASFSRSGVLTVRAGKTAAKKTGVAMTSASLVLATLQQDHPDVWVRSAVPDAAGRSFTIHLSKAVPVNTKVAWFIIN